MSRATESRTIKFISKSGTYTAIIQSPNGDLWQEYKGTKDEVTDISPKFDELQPPLYFVCTSSRSAEGLATPTSMQYFFNGSDTPIAFDNNGKSTGVYAGLFERIVPSGKDQPYYGLKIINNLVVAANYSACVIKMKAEMAYGVQTDDIDASYTIPIGPSTGDSYRVTIAAGDSKVFNLTSQTDSCTLVAKAFLSGVELTKGLTYKWKQMKFNKDTALWEWQELQNTDKTLFVSASQVNNVADFMVEVFKDKTSIGTDVQSVTDVSDPLMIDAHPVPADEAIEEGNDERSKVVYTPKLVYRNSGNVADANAKFFFGVRSASGVLLSNDDLLKNATASFTVTVDMCKQGGGDVTLYIASAD